jgi:hypothetical protein
VKLTNNISNEKGIVLLSVMGFIIALFIAGVAANENVNMDIANSVKGLSSTQSLYIAEAGLERAKGELVSRYTNGNWNNFNMILKGDDGTAGTSDDGILSFGNNVAFHGGAYSVKVINDAKDPGGTNDTNDTVMIESTGIFKGTTVKLRMTIRMNKVPYMQGSVTLLGEADTLFNGNSFTIDGRDYKLSDGSTPTGTSNQYAITAPDGSSMVGVIDTLSSGQKDNIKGLGYDASASPVTPSVGVSTLMTTEDVKCFIDSVKNIADNNLINPSSLSGVDLGTVSTPKITYISSTDSTSIKINGNTSGAGILVVEGGNLEITLTGNMSWTGIIIVSGSSVGFKETGSGQVTGGIIVFENNNPDVNKELEVGGDFSIKYSSEAVAMANNAVLNKKKYSVVSWQKVNS